MAPACQSFLDNVVARDRRHLIAELPRGSLARDRFDSDCVLGTQFESLSAPPRILVLTEISPNPAISPESAGLSSRFCLPIAEGKACEHAIAKELQHLTTVWTQRGCQRLEYVIEQGAHSRPREEELRPTPLWSATLAVVLRDPGRCLVQAFGQV